MKIRTVEFFFFFQILFEYKNIRIARFIREKKKNVFVAIYSCGYYSVQLRIDLYF